MLDSRFVVSSGLQELFRDENTGLPLRSGLIYSWRDSARTEPKPLYMISGTPPDYTYTALPNPLTLTGIGTFSDGDGNDIVPYYFVMEGLPSDNSTVLDLYYIQVFNSGNVEQFTRQGWPNITSENQQAENNIQNFIPNGQFLANNVTPAAQNSMLGQISQPITNIAYGGWTFERSTGSTATDFVTFTRNTSFTSNPSGSPRYTANISCTNPYLSDAFKDLRVAFDDVNKFASNTQQYTFAIWGKTNTSSSLPLNVYLIKNYGSGGSPSTSTLIGTLNLTNTMAVNQIVFTFGEVSSESIGPNDDDNVQIAIRFPTSTPFNVSFVDAVLALGNINIQTFPITTTSEFLYEGIAGFMPVPASNGFDVGLPLVLSQSGLIFSDSEVATIKWFASDFGDIPDDYLACDGSQYLTSSYHKNIPLARLQKKLATTSNGLPTYGTGTNFSSTAFYDTAAFYLYNNSAGVFGAPTDVSTGFTFGTVSSGQSSVNGNAYVVPYNGPQDILFIGSVAGTVANISGFGSPIDNGTSGFTLSIIINNSLSRFAIYVNTNSVVPSTLAGDYFRFNTLVNSTPTYQTFVPWFTVNGSGTAPSVTGTLIQINLLSTDTTGIMNQKITAAINGAVSSWIQTVAGSSITPGSYWKFSNATNNYYVWYTVDGIGTDPNPGGALPIPIAVSSTDTAIDVAANTGAIINGLYFAVPDLRNVLIRGWDFGNGTGPGVLLRYGVNGNANNAGDQVGTYQLGTDISTITTGTLVTTNNIMLMPCIKI